MARLQLLMKVCACFVAVVSAEYRMRRNSALQCGPTRCSCCCSTLKSKVWMAWCAEIYDEKTMSLANGPWSQRRGRPRRPGKPGSGLSNRATCKLASSCSHASDSFVTQNAPALLAYSYIRHRRMPGCCRCSLVTELRSTTVSVFWD